MISNVQPITPYQPTTSVQVANQIVPRTPNNPTSLSLTSTVPTQSISNYNAIKQLPPQVVTALTSQQAVNNSTLSKAEKISKGILPGVAGVTFQQLSQPGQTVKPGAGSFAKALQEKLPGLPVDKVAQSVLMTGANGVNNAANLVKNVPAQLSAVTNSIKNATSGLTNNGILTGKESPTQIAGVVMAAATIGIPQVTAALKDPLSVASSIGSSISGIGQSIASGNYAAGLADKLTSGLGGVAAGLAGAASGALSALSSGITGFLDKAPSGITGLIASLSGAAQNAFNLAEKSFGNLKAGVENQLGGLPETQEAAPSKVLQSVRDLDTLAAELKTAENNYYDSRITYIREGTDDALNGMKEAKTKYVAAEQKYEQARANILNAGSNNPSANNVGAVIGAQAINTLGSSLFNAPNSSNTGSNSLPGGLGAFVSQVGTGVSNAISSLKSIGTKASTSIAGLPSTIGNIGSIAGNIVSKVQNAVGSASNLISKGIGSTGLIGNIQNAVDNVLGGVKAASTGLISNITSALDSIGNAPGQIKNAILAVNTFADKATITSTLAAATSDDPKVPAPVFEEVQVKIEPDQYQTAQVNAQLQIDELLAQREIKSFELDQAINDYLLSPEDASLISKVDALKTEIEDLDSQIIVSQEDYNKLLFAQT